MSDSSSVAEARSDAAADAARASDRTAICSAGWFRRWPPPMPLRRTRRTSRPRGPGWRSRQISQIVTRQGSLVVSWSIYRLTKACNPHLTLTLR